MHKKDITGSQTPRDAAQYPCRSCARLIKTEENAVQTNRQAKEALGTVQNLKSKSVIPQTKMMIQALWVVPGTPA